MKIASINISGGFYIGNENQEYLDREAAEHIDDELLSQLINFINTEAPDVVCFQEIITTPDINYIGRIAENTRLKHYESFELSPCNLVKDTDCGLAIMSHYPIEKTEKGLFPNPRIAKTTSSGNTYYTYDKGYLICDVNSTKILTHHGFPFRRFNSSAEEHPEVFKAFGDVIKQKNPDLITGDFNTDSFMNLMNLPDYKRTIDDVTTVDGMKFDDILIKNDVEFTKKIVRLLSDHFAIVVEI